MEIAACTLHWALQEVTFSYLTQGGQISGEQAIMAMLWFIWVPCTVQENMIFQNGQGILHSRVAGEELPRKLQVITASIELKSSLLMSTFPPRHRSDFMLFHLKLSFHGQQRDTLQHSNEPSNMLLNVLCCTWVGLFAERDVKIYSLKLQLDYYYSSQCPISFNMNFSLRFSLNEIV